MILQCYRLVILCIYLVFEYFETFLNYFSERLTMPHEIVYPQGCRPVTDDLGPDELIRRLKVLQLI